VAGKARKDMKAFAVSASAFLTALLACTLLATASPPHIAVSQTAAACPVISARLGLHYPFYVSPHTVFPENSVGAINGAHTAGAPKAEIDVQYSSNGVPMAIHDSTVNRTTAYTGAVSSYTAVQLTAMPLRMEGLGPASGWMSGEHLPTVQAALTVAQLDGMTVSIEIKPASLTAVQARQLLRVIWAAGGTGNTVEATGDIRSNLPAVLAAMRTAGYWGHLTLIVAGPVPLPPGSPYWMESVDYFNDWPGAPVAAPVPPAAVAALQANGVLVDGYTPDTAAQIAATAPGLNQVTTDHVHAALAWEAVNC
jgi:glycerophosphoryl diester phosphodiesterase